MRVIKDSVLSTVTVENFVEAFANGRRFERPLAVVANHHWRVKLEKCTEDEVDYLGIYIGYSSNSQEAKEICVEYAVSVRNEKPNASTQFKFARDFVPNDLWGRRRSVQLSRVFAEDGGFLKNGALTVHVEIRAYAITDKEGIRRLNFHDPFGGCVRFNMERGQKTFYAMKQMVMYHSPVLAKKIATGKEKFTFRRYAGQSGEDFEWFLQLIHGLSAGQLPEWSLSSIFEYAVDFDTFNVIQRSDILFSDCLNQVDVTKKFKTIHLKRQLKSVKSLEELKVIVESDWFDLEEMKTVANKFFSFSVEFRRPQMSGKRRKGFFSRVLRTLKKLAK